MANSGGINFSQGNGVNTGNFVDVNVISGNTGNGININTAGAVTITGNVIGLNAAGAAARPNTTNGISTTASSNNVIGGTTAQTRNVIAGNGTNGITITSGPTGTASGNAISGNYIGLDAGGNTAIPNGSTGVAINSGGGTTTNNSIGAHCRRQAGFRATTPPVSA